MKKIIVWFMLFVFGISNVFAYSDTFVHWYNNEANLYKELKAFVVKTYEKKNKWEIDFKNMKSSLKQRTMFMKETYSSAWDSQYDNFVAPEFDSPYWSLRKYNLWKYIVENTDFVTNPDANIKIIDSLVTKFLLKLTKLSDSQINKKIEKMAIKIEKILPKIKNKKTQDYVKYLEYELLTKHTPYIKLLKGGYYAYFIDKDFDKDWKYEWCWEKWLPNNESKCMMVVDYTSSEWYSLYLVLSPYKYTKVFNGETYIDKLYDSCYSVDNMSTLFNKSWKKCSYLQWYLDKIGEIWWINFYYVWWFRRLHELTNNDIGDIVKSKLNLVDSTLFVFSDLYGDVRHLILRWVNRFVDIYDIWPREDGEYLSDWKAWPVVEEEK